MCCCFHVSLSSSIMWDLYAEKRVKLNKTASLFCHVLSFLSLRCKWTVKWIKWTLLLLYCMRFMAKNLCVCSSVNWFLCFQITLNVLLNLAGVLFAFASIGLYIIYITGDFWWSCGRTDLLPVNSTELHYEIYLLETCHMGREMYLVSARNTVIYLPCSGANSRVRRMRMSPLPTIDARWPTLFLKVQLKPGHVWMQLIMGALPRVFHWSGWMHL